MFPQVNFSPYIELRLINHLRKPAFWIRLLQKNHRYASLNIFSVCEIVLSLIGFYRIYIHFYLLILHRCNHQCSNLNLKKPTNLNKQYFYRKVLSKNAAYGRELLSGSKITTIESCLVKMCCCDQEKTTWASSLTRLPVPL